MVKAFVFGKFLPFHKGHEAMIRWALTQCDFLSVLVCREYGEKIPGEVRKDWITATFADEERMEVRVLNYDHRLLPNTSRTSLSVSETWSKTLKKHYPDYDLLITSEPYGKLVAGFMGIRHLAFDMERERFPISASAIRRDLFSNWHYLPAAVKPYFAIKVVILGTESTGKTTLTARLARHYGCSFVTEAGRDLISDSKEFTFEDLRLVAAEHAKRIEAALSGDSPLVIIDTDIHITASYSRFTFKKDLLVSADIYTVNRAELYLYLTSDAPYFQDGTRLDRSDRDRLDRSHKAMLAEHRIEFVEISGDWESRFEQALAAISKLIAISTDTSDHLAG